MQFNRTPVRRCNMTHLNLPATELYFRYTGSNAPRSVFGVAFVNMSQRAVNGRGAETRAKHYPYNSHHRKNIQMPDRWVDDPVLFGLEAFVDLGPPPSPDHSIDRINNDADYGIGNMRWASALEQAHNKGTLSGREVGY